MQGEEVSEGDQTPDLVNDLTSSSDGRHPKRRTAQPIGAPSARVIALLLSAVGLLIGGYALGRQDSDPAIVAEPEPATTTIPEFVSEPAPTVVAIIQPPRIIIADVLGPGRILDGIGLGFGNQALVFCGADDPESRLQPSFAVAHAGVDAQANSYLISYQAIASPMPGPRTCEQCAPERVTLDDEVMLIGACAAADDSGETVAYVIAPHADFWRSPLALQLRCDVTALEVVGEELVVTSRRHRTPLSAPLIRPAIRLVRTGGHFVADDLDLLQATCDLGQSSQLRGFDPDDRGPTSPLPHEIHDSAIGEIGVHDGVLVALDRAQCETLATAWWASQGPGGEPSERALATLTGLNPPDGLDDWFYLCQPAGE